MGVVVGYVGCYCLCGLVWFVGFWDVCVECFIVGLVCLVVGDGFVGRLWSGGVRKVVEDHLVGAYRVFAVDLVGDVGLLVVVDCVEVVG